MDADGTLLALALESDEALAGYVRTASNSELQTFVLALALGLLQSTVKEIEEQDA